MTQCSRKVWDSAGLAAEYLSCSSFAAFSQSHFPCKLLRWSFYAQPTLKGADPLNAVVVNILAFVAGFSIMSIELLGGRILAPYFGGSIYVWGSIITIFMLSLSFGYLLGGRLSMRWVSLKVFAAIFLFGALTLYPLTLLAVPLMEWVFGLIEDPRYGSLLASFVMFAVPTVILGMISPYSVRLLVSVAEESGKVAGGLYFISTLGSALGTLATSFYFVLWFDINQIIFGLVVALVLMSGVAFFADRAENV